MNLMQALMMLKFQLLLILSHIFKNTELAIKNKLKELLTKLREFKFLATLVIEFKEIGSDDATK